MCERKALTSRKEREKWGTRPFALPRYTCAVEVSHRMYSVFPWPNVLTALIGGIVGGILTAIFTAVSRKTSLITYNTRIERLAVSGDDPIFGNVRVVWGNQNQTVRNLYMVSVEIENGTIRDFENINFTVYTNNETFFLSERTMVVGEPYALNWSKFYRDQLAVPQGAAPTDAQSATYYHRREFELPVFNRSQRVHLNFLCTRPADDAAPGVWVSTQLKGAKLILKNHPVYVWGVPRDVAIGRGIVVVIAVCAICTHYIRHLWITNTISLVAGLTVAAWGVGAYRLERRIKRLIAG